MISNAYLYDGSYDGLLASDTKTFRRYFYHPLISACVYDVVTINNYTLLPPITYDSISITAN